MNILQYVWPPRIDWPILKQEQSHESIEFFQSNPRSDIRQTIHFIIRKLKPSATALFALPFNGNLHDAFVAAQRDNGCEADPVIDAFFCLVAFALAKIDIFHIDLDSTKELGLSALFFRGSAEITEVNF